MAVVDKIQAYWEEVLRSDGSRDGRSWLSKKRLLHERRGAKVVRITAEGVPYRSTMISSLEHHVDYQLYVTFFIKQGKHFYIEEGQEQHRAIFKGSTIVEDRSLEIKDPIKKESPGLEFHDSHGSDVREVRFSYDRQKAVQYANRWWNSYNPQYKHFENDCTNFISQCLRAGGAPMWGMANRSKGWWYNGSSWSYSWTVANSLRWYLSGSSKGLKGKEVNQARDLIPGDIICYDFEGDGRWNHNTIVVEKDAFGEPLVNAHTYNSYHRYWDYEDSTAYTPQIKYKFFRIGE
ncbi:hypothetical protein GLW05_02835 [Pontibacillus yanchengensis]|uniref:Putative amidase domain-containing protein n=1 Tax=Pontibacillus yanchengensis TaxID=462910 RepID=A0A6I4ZXR4_9BACI|nr:amidase domain-containing protein [Pontibacillus yanchengensis]MYL32543.1 hypothetical protein [Pontibacillus yanchengensis]